MPHKHKKTKKKDLLSSSFLIYTISFLIIISICSISAYLFIKNENLIEQNKLLQKEITQLKQQNNSYKKAQEEQTAKYFEEKTKALEIEYTTPIDNQYYVEQTQEDNKQKFIFEDKNIYQDEKIVKKEETITYPEIEEEVIVKKPKKTIVKSNKPKLAIIIDDVTTSHQIRKIRNIGYDVNIAFLPPTPRHPSSARIAKKVDTYMIHLPLQASSNKYDEANTLYINDPITKIENRILKLRELYPKAKFINNHTGSKFTSNKQAMDKLFRVLKKYNYTFIDSRTTAKSVAKLSAKKYGMRMLSRNIFLDNKKDSTYITRQLKKAIKLAKKHGTAIAIGHPYGITFETLKNSKHLLKDLDLVYVDRL